MGASLAGTQQPGVRAPAPGAGEGGHGKPRTGYKGAGSPPEGSPLLTNDLSAGLLVVLGVLAGLSGLLVTLTVLDPTTVRRPVPSQLAASTHEPS